MTAPGASQPTAAVAPAGTLRRGADRATDQRDAGREISPSPPAPSTHEADFPRLMSKRNTTTVSTGLVALYEQTEQRIRDGVRSAATLEMQRRHGTWIAAELGAHTRLRAIDEIRLDALAAPRPARRFGPSTLRKRLSTLRGVLALAHRRRWINRMPAFPVVIAPWRPRQRFLNTYADAVRLFDALPLHRAEWMWLCLWTGQHASDVERMSWADVSIDPGDPSFIRRNTKNRRPPLRVRMPRPLLAVLRAKFDRERPAPEARIVLPWPSRKHTLPMTCYRLGLPPLNSIDLRHTLFTWAVRKLGITPAVVAWAGHSSPAMMARTYAHALPVALAEVASELDAFAGEAPTPHPPPPKRASGEPIASGGRSGAGMKPGKVAA